MVRLLVGHSNPHIEALGVIPSGPFVIFGVGVRWPESCCPSLLEDLSHIQRR